MPGRRHRARARRAAADASCGCSLPPRFGLVDGGADARALGGATDCGAGSTRRRGRLGAGARCGASLPQRRGSGSGCCAPGRERSARCWRCRWPIRSSARDGAQSACEPAPLRGDAAARVTVAGADAADVPSGRRCAPRSSSALSCGRAPTDEAQAMEWQGGRRPAGRGAGQQHQDHRVPPICRWPGHPAGARGGREPGAVMT